MCPKKSSCITPPIFLIIFHWYNTLLSQSTANHFQVVLMTNLRWQKSCYVCELKITSERHKEKQTWLNNFGGNSLYPSQSCVKSVNLGNVPYWKRLSLWEIFSWRWTSINVSTGPSLLTPVLKLYLGFELWPPSEQLWLGYESRVTATCLASNKVQIYARISFVSSVQDLLH